MANELNEINKVEESKVAVAGGIDNEELVNLLESVPAVAEAASTADLPKVDIDGIKEKGAGKLLRDKDSIKDGANVLRDKDGLNSIKEGVNVIKDKDGISSLQDNVKDKDALNSLKNKDGANVIKGKENIKDGANNSKDKDGLNSLKEGINVLKDKEVQIIKELLRDKQGIKSIKEFLRDASGKDSASIGKDASRSESVKESGKDASGKDSASIGKDASRSESVKESGKDASGKDSASIGKDASRSESVKESGKDASGKDSASIGKDASRSEIKEAAKEAVQKFDANAFNSVNAKSIANSLAKDIESGKVTQDTMLALQKYYKLAGETAGANGQAQFMRTLQTALQSRGLFALHAEGQPNENGVVSHRLVITDRNGTQVGEASFSSGGRRRK